jgi:hypothetical protein
MDPAVPAGGLEMVSLGKGLGDDLMLVQVDRAHRLLLRQQLAQEQPPRVQRLLQHDQRLGHEQYREQGAQASPSSTAGPGTAATCSATPAT